MGDSVEGRTKLPARAREPMPSVRSRDPSKGQLLEQIPTPTPMEPSLPFCLESPSL